MAIDREEIAAVRAAAAAGRAQAATVAPAITSTPVDAASARYQAAANVLGTVNVPTNQIGSLNPQVTDLSGQLSTQKAQAQKLLAAAKKSGNKNDIAAAEAALDSISQAEDLMTLLGGAGGGGSTGLSGNRTDASYVAEGRSGTSNTGKNYINGKLVSAEEFNKWLGVGGGTGTGGSAATDLAAQQAKENRQSAYDLLLSEFSRYGLESLVTPLKDLIQQNVSPSEFGLRLTQTDAYKKRFAANDQRIAKGLAALSPAEYIAMEDQYQNIMRNYGLPASYYTKDSLGTQAGFNQLLANDVSAVELEDRVATAQNRVINAAPEIKTALKQFYPDITDGDILAYTLDPTKGLTDIKRKVQAAEIGGAALAQGLATDVSRAEDLAKYGITADQARQGYQTAAEVLPRGSQLASIYGFEPYTQGTAEQEIFNLAGSAEAAKKRKKLIETEKATFGGAAGVASGALSRDRAYSSQSYREPGAGAY